MLKEFLPQLFLASTYEETYLSLIYLVNGPHLWKMTSAYDVLLPTERVLPGRTKKKRRLESWELKRDDTELRQGETRKKCGLCRQVDHKTNCLYATPVPQQTAPSGTQQSTTTGQDPQGSQPTQVTKPSQITSTQPTLPPETQNHILPTQTS